MKRQCSESSLQCCMRLTSLAGKVPPEPRRHKLRCPLSVCVCLCVCPAVNFILTIGLSVDYSLHIGHGFLTSTGTRRERARHSLAHMGASVFNGGISCFLGVVALGAAQGYIFRVFFKSFAFAVAFGLFHGLILFPVLLALFGASSYQSRGPKSPSLPTTETLALSTGKPASSAVVVVAGTQPHVTRNPTAAQVEHL